MPKKTVPTKAGRQTADAVPIHFNLPVNRPSVNATNILIQPGEFEVVVSFYEIVPPFIPPVKSDEEALEMIKRTGLRADCVSRVTIAKERFAAFANAMQQAAQDLQKAS